MKKEKKLFNDYIINRFRELSMSTMEINYIFILLENSLFKKHEKTLFLIQTLDL